MEFRGIYLIVAACLLAFVKGAPTRQYLSWFYHAVSGCGGGNLIQIHTDSCTNTGCAARADGTCNDNTRFDIVKVGNRKCIQFTNSQDGKTYALKVVSSSHVTFEEQSQGCHKGISSHFLFKESKTRKMFVYEHSGKCLTSNCSGQLSLFKSTKDVMKERKCFFRRLNSC